MVETPSLLLKNILASVLPLLFVVAGFASSVASQEANLFSDFSRSGASPLTSPTRRRLTTTTVTNAAQLTAALENSATIELAANISLTNRLLFNGLTGVIIDGKGFEIDGRNSVQCLSIQNGADVTLTNLVITRCSGSIAGGVRIQSSSTVMMTLCTITSNIAGLYGGGVYVTTAATVAMTACIISSNIAAYGGGLYVSHLGTVVTMTACTTNSNTANLYNGGGFYIVNSATLIMTSCTTSSNTALSSSMQGGGFYIVSSPTVTMSDCIISSNNADIGGGFYITGSAIVVTSCIISSNTALSSITRGGGLYISQTTVTMISCIISVNNATSGIGGGLFLGGGLITHLVGCSFFGNSAGSGGDIYQDSGTTEFYSLCPGGSSFAGTGSLDCFQCTGPADLGNTSACAACTASTPHSCCGAMMCSASASICSSTELEICPNPTPMPTPLPTSVPTLTPTLTTPFPTSIPSPVPTLLPTLLPTLGKLSSPDRSFCEDCSAGEYIKDAKECVECESGRYAPQPLTGACILCGAGSFTNKATKATTCSPCNAGSFSAARTAVKCTLCDVGSASVSSQSSCTLCDAEGSSTCVACAAGTASAMEGASWCSKCSAGQFQSRSSEPSCELCAGGKFSSESASTACSECPRGYSSQEGSSSCEGQADKNYFMYQGVATECPKHSVCGGTTLMPQPMRGYWVDRRSLEFSNEIYKCPRETCSPQTTTITSRRQLIDGSTGNDGSCWEVSAYEQSNKCDSGNLLCIEGSRGALCGSCNNAFIYSSVDRICVACDVSQRRLIIILSTAAGLALMAAGICFSGALERIPTLLAGFGVVNSGALRVAWANYQIIQSASRNIDVSFPSPFKEMMSALSLFSFDFLSLECFFENSNHFLSVYLYSAAPIILVGVLVLVHYTGVRYSSMVGSAIPTTSTLTYRLLLLGYLVLPPVSLKLLQALDCVTIADKSYLRIDTSIDCDSKEFTTFKVIDGMLITLYLSTPIVWFALLFRERSRLNPPVGARADEHPQEALEHVLSVRDEDTTLKPLRFLFDSYRPSFYYIECLEMYRRVLFVGVLPLLAAASSRRAALGIFFSLCSLGFYGEVAPFLDPSTNILAYVAQYANLLTFGAALAIEVGLDEGMDSFLFGCILVAINVVVVGFIFSASVTKFRREQVMQQWRRVMTDEELQVVNAVMTPELSTDDRDTMVSTPSIDGIELVEHGKSSAGDKETQDARSLQALKQCLIESKDVKLTKRVGAGAFGEVFKGTVLGQPVAVKTMLTINDASVKAFRDEILLTATLRHPNIVSFVGACWGKELMALVLEWVPRGSLADLLEDKSLDLHWSDPLLKLAMDVARGMIYLHGREYFDERDCEHKRCILHRDLKPDNALVTDYTSLKITDFGTSRAKAADDVTMTGVGTPLFCAPELSRDEAYDEKADVYSFGLVLIDMASDEFIATFIGERWKVAFNKKKVPNPQALAYNKVLGPIWEGKWRPVSDENPIEHAPGTINDLIFRCTAHDPQKRPSFVEILEFLAGPCMVEVEGAVFSRYPKIERGHHEDAPTNTSNPNDIADEETFQTRNPMPGAHGGTDL